MTEIKELVPGGEGIAVDKNNRLDSFKVLANWDIVKPLYAVFHTHLKLDLMPAALTCGAGSEQMVRAAVTPVITLKGCAILLKTANFIHKCRAKSCTEHLYHVI